MNSYDVQKIKVGDKLKVVQSMASEYRVNIGDIHEARTEAILNEANGIYYIVVHMPGSAALINNITYVDSMRINCDCLEFVVEVKPICVCDSRDLFYRGCKCGQWEREKNA